MAKPQRIQLSRKKGFRLPPNTVVVARGPGRKWGNPFKVNPVMFEFPDAETVKKQFEIWAWKHPDFILSVKRELKGKNLACWCPLGGACHADVLLEIANT